ncbi:hypothetical protein D3C81_1348510 [compost metagenome]
MVLHFLAVERQRQVAATLGQLAGHCGGQWNALVGRAEHHVVLDPGGVDGVGIARAQLRQQGTGVETAGVEEIGAQPAGLEGELAEAQGIGGQGQLQETVTVVAHQNSIHLHLERKS